MVDFVGIKPLEADWTRAAKGCDFSACEICPTLDRFMQDANTHSRTVRVPPRLLGHSKMYYTETGDEDYTVNVEPVVSTSKTVAAAKWTYTKTLKHHEKLLEAWDDRYRHARLVISELDGRKGNVLDSYLEEHFYSFMLRVISRLSSLDEQTDSTIATLKLE